VSDARCSLVQLTNGSRGAYVIGDQLNVTRQLTVAGHPLTLPTIDGTAAIRVFRSA
jgi:hypothetical protein